jgi:GrpB-like predicted nucleotidyltransferase (UPF0157 family)
VRVDLAMRVQGVVAGSPRRGGGAEAVTLEGSDAPGGVSREKWIRQARIGPPVVLNGPITLVDHDPAWAERFVREAARIRGALGARARSVEHVGSTSVPGLAAKPVIDVLLVVTDSADEPSYVPALEAAGYVLRIREPGWHEHRMFKGLEFAVNLHVFSVGSAEIDRMLLLRDWLRQHPDDRELYERVKRDLAGRTWKYGQDYADAKGPVVEEIIARAWPATPGRTG